MALSRHPLPILVLFLAFTACNEDRTRSSTSPPIEGLKVVRTGENPAKAPGPKGTMIDMDADEVRVILVQPKGAAAEAGFAPGDRILAADGQDLASEEDLNKILEKAKDKKVIFEVRSGKQILTLSLATSEPDWIVLSGDTFKGFLLTRIQSARKIPEPRSSGPAPDLRLPTYDGKPASLREFRGHPTVLLFWGTFSEPCYAHLQALHRICQQYAPRGLKCLAIDTMELFTAVGKTGKYAAEMAKVRRDIYPQGPIPVDLFMESERQFGIAKLPTLLLVDAEGNIVGRHGPMKDPFAGIPKAIEPILPASPIK